MEKVKPQGGVTLVELLVVLAVLGILLGIATPGYLAWRNSVMIQEAQQAIVAALARERSEAKRMNEARRLNFTATGATVTRYTPTAVAGRAYTWPHGVTVSTSTAGVVFVPPYGEAREVSGSGWGSSPPASFGLSVMRGGKSRDVRVVGVFGKAVVK